MLYGSPRGSQLTVIGEGVPFPSHANVSRMFMMMRESVEMLTSAGLPAGKYDIESESSSDAEWEAVVLHRETEASFRLDGLVHPADGEPVVVRTVWLNKDGSEQRRIDYSDHERVAGFDLRIPWRAEWVRSDDVLIALALDTVSRVPIAEAKRESAVPDGDRLDALGPGAMVMDYSDPSSEASAAAEGQQNATWTLTRTVDDVEFDDPGSAYVPEPGTKEESTPEAAYRWLAIAIVVGTAAVVFVVFRGRSMNR